VVRHRQGAVARTCGFNQVKDETAKAPRTPRKDREKKRKKGNAIMRNQLSFLFLFSCFSWRPWRLGGFIFLHLVTLSYARADDPWVVYKGTDGPGKGKHIVLVSGDEEYRSEEALPQLGKILANHHGFTCTVLFAINPDDGTINPNKSDNIPGLEKLKDADLMILFTRFRNLPDEQMKYIVEYVDSGRPIIGMRTATHAFNLRSKTYGKYSWGGNGEWKGGFGRQILGETWVAHWGNHGKQSTRGILVKDEKDHPILRGIQDGDIWGPTDVYQVHLPLPGDSKPLVLGQVLQGMKLDDPPVEGKKNDPMMPIAWTKTYKGESGKSGRIFTTTMGASQDLQSEGLRRLLVNAAYWAVGMENKISANPNVVIVGEYKPTPFGFGGFKKGVKPSDLAGE
jgi:type 1 glutamine amidotransferase